MANPDFDSAYVHVRKWWIEVDEAGPPHRELGFDVNGKGIVAGPFGENFGFWTDSTMTFNPSEHQVVPEEAFGLAWSLFQQQWEANRGGDTAASQT